MVALLIAVTSEPIADEGGIWLFTCTSGESLLAKILRTFIKRRIDGQGSEF